jgi:hypothetical protein
VSKGAKNNYELPITNCEFFELQGNANNNQNNDII